MKDEQITDPIATRPAERNGDRRGIQSIEVGGALLQALVRHGTPMILKDLARDAGMPPAKAHPYLVSFGKLGLIEQDPLTGRYGLGTFSLQLGLSALHGLNPLRVATPEAAKLSDEIGQNVAIAVWGNQGATVVSIEECSRQVHVNMRVGTVMNLVTSATGRVFAAFLPARLTETLIAEELAHLACAADPSLRLSRSQFDNELEEIRRQRLARAVGQPIPGINAFCAPVFDHNGHVALTITAMGAADNFDADWSSPLAEKLRSCAESISGRLGKMEG
ncbi:Transcriptional regulatory protein [Aromatoleum aromaticum EbN1]|uniref:Transcriptional regulatory protein n=1 Tax=Aromatoleum aromaticum (strain DSM 19018 / LMG 30748 / EbN1) TaxID=76114 RepID=Q5P3Y3_AROAE|nr:IclR family transcriptional regulator [Aromatoleum aromaticum]CAI07980.1 Transcriptional regulatory protein [Aromatoleum aromaticum EbN1]